MIPFRIRHAALGGVVLCLALSACGDKPPRTANVSEALPNLPLPPHPTFLERTGGPDALQITVRTPASTDDVLAYYRRVLKQGRWRLVNDAKDSEGATVLFAQQDGPPLWVRIRSEAEGGGTLVELSGAVVPKADSAAPSPAS
jgi:hypothetical protein